MDRFKELLEDAKANFGDVLLFVNSHSGYDGWTTEERDQYVILLVCFTRRFFTEAIAIQKSFPVVIAHETHRARVMYNPWVTRELVQKFPEIKLTADLSHWFNVCERALDDEMDVIHLIAKHVHHIHGRVGHSQGPQVPDPRSELWSKVCCCGLELILAVVGSSRTLLGCYLEGPKRSWRACFILRT